MSKEKFWTKSYDSHVPTTLDYPTEDLGTLLVNAMKKFPERVGLSFMDKDILYKDELEGVQKFATFLQKNGLEKGDVVAINLPNTPQYIFALYGTLLAGGICTGVSALLSPVEMAYQINDSKAKFVVTMDIIYEKIFPKILDKLPNIEVIIPTNISEYIGFSGFKLFMGKLI